MSEDRKNSICHEDDVDGDDDDGDGKDDDDDDDDVKEDEEDAIDVDDFIAVVVDDDSRDSEDASHDAISMDIRAMSDTKENIESTSGRKRQIRMVVLGTPLMVLLSLIVLLLFSFERSPLSPCL